MNMYYDLKYFTGKVRTKSPQLKKNATKYLARFPYNPILHIAYGFFDERRQWQKQWISFGTGVLLKIE